MEIISYHHSISYCRP